MSSINTGLNAYRPLPPNDPTQRANTPVGHATMQRLNEIRRLLSEQNIDAMLRNPESPAVAEVLAQLSRVINKDTLSLMRRDPSGDTSKALSVIATLLSESAIHKRTNESLGAYVKSEARKYEATRFDNLLRLSLADPEAGWDTAQGIWNELQASILASQAHAGHIKNNASTLRGYGELFNIDKDK